MFKPALGLLKGGACPHFDDRKDDFEKKLSSATAKNYVCIENLSAVMYVNGKLKCASSSCGKSYLVSVKDGKATYEIIPESDFSQS